MITEKSAADFQDLASVALDNAGINTVAWLRAAQDLANTTVMAPQHPTAALIEADMDKIA